MKKVLNIRSSSLRNKTIQILPAQSDILTEICTTLSKSIQSSLASVEDGNKLADCFKQYASGLKSEEDFSILGTHFEQVSELIVTVEQLKSELINQIKEKCLLMFGEVVVETKIGKMTASRFLLREASILSDFVSLYQNYFTQVSDALPTLAENSKSCFSQIQFLCSDSQDHKQASEENFQNLREQMSLKRGGSRLFSPPPTLHQEPPSPSSHSTASHQISSSSASQSSDQTSSPSLSGFGIRQKSDLDTSLPLSFSLESNLPSSSSCPSLPPVIQRKGSRIGNTPGSPSVSHAAPSSPRATCPGDIETAPKSEMMTKLQLWNLLDSEEDFRVSLDILVERYVRPMTTDERWSSRITEEERSTIFSNIHEINVNQRQLLRELRQSLREWPIPSVTDFFSSKLSRFDMYIRYASNFSNSMYTLSRLKKESNTIKNLVKQSIDDKDLIGLMKTPLNGISRWHSLLKQLSEEDPNNSELANLLSKFTALHQEGAKYLALHQDIELVRSVQSRIKGLNEVLVHPDRKFIREGPILLAGKQEHLFLFNDLLIIGKAGLVSSVNVSKKSQKYKFSQKLVLRKFSVIDPPDSNEIQLTDKKTTLTLMPVPSDKYDKQTWLKDLVSVIEDQNKERVFGMHLEDLMNSAREKNRDVPTIVEKTIAWLIPRGLQVEGLFRVCGSQNLIDRYKDEFDTGKNPEFNPTDDVHSISGVLKLWLRDLPVPLLTSELYDDFLNAYQSNQNEEERLAAVKRVVNLMPRGNKFLLQHLMSFFVLVTSHSDVNKMNSANLAIVFGPSILWRRPSSDFAQQKIASSVVQFLIDKYDEIFKDIEKERRNTKTKELPPTPPQKILPPPPPKGPPTTTWRMSKGKK